MGICFLEASCKFMDAALAGYEKLHRAAIYAWNRLLCCPGSDSPRASPSPSPSPSPGPSPFEAKLLLNSCFDGNRFARTQALVIRNSGLLLTSGATTTSGQSLYRFGTRSSVGLRLLWDLKYKLGALNLKLNLWKLWLLRHYICIVFIIKDKFKIS